MYIEIDNNVALSNYNELQYNTTEGDRAGHYFGFDIKNNGDIEYPIPQDTNNILVIDLQTGGREIHCWNNKAWGPQKVDIDKQSYPDLGHLVNKWISQIKPQLSEKPRYIH